MSKYMAGVFPRQNRLWLILGVAALLLTMLVPGPMVARADDSNRDRGNGPVRFTANAVAFVAAAGNAERLSRERNRFETTGEVIMGCVFASGWTAIPTMNPAGCSPASKNLIVYHSSTTKVSEGKITGQASGTFTVGDLNGRYSGKIVALYDPAWGYSPSGFPLGIYQIDDQGTWTASDKHGNKAKGTFTVHLEWNPAAGTLVGPVSFVGAYRQDHDD